MTDKQIPFYDFPEISGIQCFDDSSEILVNLADYFDSRIIIEPAYFRRGIKGSVNSCLVRQGVADKMALAMNFLPDNIIFKVFDSWRPIAVQQYLFDEYYNKLKFENPDWDRSRLYDVTRNFVSPPSYDESKPSAHNTGGAIDLTLYDLSEEKELDMGTGFDDFTPRSHTCYFEENDISEKIRENRRLLYWCMIEAGFTNLPTEWWHYDYGDAFWSYFTGRPAFYKGMVFV